MTFHEKTPKKQQQHKNIDSVAFPHDQLLRNTEPLVHIVCSDPWPEMMYHMTSNILSMAHLQMEWNKKKKE